MFGCLDVGMFGCLDVWMFGCLDVWTLGCLDDGMLRCFQAFKIIAQLLYYTTIRRILGMTKMDYPD